MLNSKKQSTSLLFGFPAVARRVQWIMICLFFHPSVLRPSIQKFSWYWLISFFLKLNMLFWCYCVWESQIFLKKVFCPKVGENGPKLGFFEFIGKKKFFWIWSIKKVYIIYCILVQIPYLRKILFLNYEPKFSQPVRLQDFYANYISKLKVDWNIEIKDWLKNFGVGIV